MYVIRLKQTSKNALLQTAFSAILPTGTLFGCCYNVKTVKQRRPNVLCWIGKGYESLTICQFHRFSIQMIDSKLDYKNNKIFKYVNTNLFL